MTDVTGAVFVSYRRSPGRCSGDVEADLVRDALRDRGIPTWSDRDDLRSEPTEEELRTILRSEAVAGAVLLVSPEVERSEMIRGVEAPAIFERVGRRDGFFVQIVSIAVPYADVDRVLGHAGGLLDVSRFNIDLIEKPVLDKADARRIANAVLKRRLDAVCQRTPRRPVSLMLDSKGAGRAVSCVLRHDFTRHFKDREARPGAYRSIEVALRDTATAVARTGERVPVLARGYVPLPLGVLVGAIYSRFCFDLAWLQRASDGSEEDWSLRSGVEGADPNVRPNFRSLTSDELVLAVSVSADIESAVTEYLTGQDWSPRATASVKLPNGPLPQGEVITARQGLKIARAAVDAARQLKDDLGMKRATLHVFLAGPVGLAVLIGQHLNTFGDCVLYEHLPHGTPAYAEVHRFRPSDYTYA